MTDKLSKQAISVYCGLRGFGTQNELADALGVTPQTISNWTTGDCLPSIPRLCEMADILGCSLDELAGRSSIRILN